jgi:hypothetical protein
MKRIGWNNIVLQHPVADHPLFFSVTVHFTCNFQALKPLPHHCELWSSPGTCNIADETTVLLSGGIKFWGYALIYAPTGRKHL